MNPSFFPFIVLFQISNINFIKKSESNPKINKQNPNSINIQTLHHQQRTLISETESPFTFHNVETLHHHTLPPLFHYIPILPPNPPQRSNKTIPSASSILTTSSVSSLYVISLLLHLLFSIVPTLSLSLMNIVFSSLIALLKTSVF